MSILYIALLNLGPLRWYSAGAHPSLPRLSSRLSRLALAAAARDGLEHLVGQHASPRAPGRHLARRPRHRYVGSRRAHRQLQGRRGWIPVGVRMSRPPPASLNPSEYPTTRLVGQSRSAARWQVPWVSPGGSMGGEGSRPTRMSTPGIPSCHRPRPPSTSYGSTPMPGGMSSGTPTTADRTSVSTEPALLAAGDEAGRAGAQPYRGTARNRVIAQLQRLRIHVLSTVRPIHMHS
jgi:hypothetical protein